jgi:hypothetical protein
LITNKQHSLSLYSSRPARARPLGGGGGGGSLDPPRRSPAPALAAADGHTAAGAQSHEPSRRFGLNRKFPRVQTRFWGGVAARPRPSCCCARACQYRARAEGQRTRPLLTPPHPPQMQRRGTQPPPNIPSPRATSLMHCAAPTSLDPARISKRASN